MNVKINVTESLKTSGKLNMIFIARRVSLCVKRDFFERVIIPTVTYGAETWGQMMWK